MSVWSPTHVQFTVLRAKNLIAKGKGGNNDVFATIQLGKEKFQTSTIKNALNPEWFEECDLPIPHMHSAVEVTLYHRGMLSDDFLGYAAVPVWEHKVSDSPKSSWIRLQSKPSSKSNDARYRGELEVKLALHCRSNVTTGSGLKKRSSPSIRNFASVFGDKFKFTRSRSFRDGRRGPGGDKLDCGQSGVASPDEDNLTRSYSMSAAYIKAMNQDRDHVIKSCNSRNQDGSVGGDNAKSVDGMGSGNMAWSDAAMSQLYSVPGHRRSCAELPPHPPPPPYCSPGASPGMRCQDDSALTMVTRPRNQTGRRPSLADNTLSNSLSNGSLNSGLGSGSATLPPAFVGVPGGIYESIKERTEPENSHTSSSSNLSSDNEEEVITPGSRSRKVKGKGHHKTSSAKSKGKDSSSNQHQQHHNKLQQQQSPPPPPLPPHLPTSLGFRPQLQRPSSYPSSGAPPLPPPFIQQPQQQQSQHGNNGSNNKLTTAEDSNYNLTNNNYCGGSAVDSGVVLDDRSSSHTNSLEGSSSVSALAASIAEWGVNGSSTAVSPPTTTAHSASSSYNKGGSSIPSSANNNNNNFRHSMTGHAFTFSQQSKQQQQQQQHLGSMTFDPRGFLNHLDREMNLNLEDHMGSGVMYMGGQGEAVVKKRTRGERDRLRQMRQSNRRFTVESSDPLREATTPREAPDGLRAVYSSMTKEELLRVVIQTKAQMIRKDQYIRDLETYIDDLLVRVMETTPRLLSRPNLLRF